MSLPSRTTILVFGVLAAAIAGGLAWQFYQFRVPDINAVGGTVLVYKVDQRRIHVGAGKGDPTAIAEALQRRFTDIGLPQVTARALGAEQVEVLIPRRADHDADVPSVKELVARVGKLEFRIVANSSDDRAGIEAAQRMVNQDRPADAKLDKEFADAQRDGLPPLGPRDADGAPSKFVIVLARGQTSTVSYRWCELGESERRALHLDSVARADPQRDAAIKEADRQRDQAVRLPSSDAAAGPFLLQGALFYSRQCKDRNLTDQERAAKEVDYFVLLRDPEFDPATGKRSPAIDGSYLSSAYADRDPVGRAIISFTLNAAGAELFATLTRKNVAEGAIGGGPPRLRHIGIILDGRVMSAPTVNSEIRDRGQISGSFTDRQVAQLVSILRAGTLPAGLLPRPVRETVVEPGQYH